MQMIFFEYNVKMLIGFTGLKGSGKDTAALYFVDKGWKRLAFADPLKEVCRHLFNFNERQLHGDLKDVIDPIWNISPRQVFTYIGTELVREKLGSFLNVGDTFWCLNMSQRLSLIDGDIVITDVRFENEASLIRSLGGWIIRVVRPGLEQSDHISEQGNFKVDETVINDSTIESLHKKIATLKWTGRTLNE